MKNLILLAGIAILSASLLSCGSSNDGGMTAVHILVDNTEKSSSRERLVSTEGLLKLIGNNGSVTWQGLNAASQNRDTTVEMYFPADATGLTKKNIKEPFVESLQALKALFLGPVEMQEKDKEGSRLYEPICRALSDLKTSPANQRVLVIVSDMIENSPLGSFYKDQPFDKVKEGLSVAMDSLPVKPNVRVVILYDPEGNPKKQAQFDRSMKIWKQLFAEKKIHYEIKANL
ncbi:MAG: hypothetical protein V4665_04745 [Patescibacteria group bacterium]